MGYCPFSGLCRDRESLSLQGSLGVVLRWDFPYRDRAGGSGARPSLRARDSTAHHGGDALAIVMPCFVSQLGRGWDWATKVATGSCGR